VCKLDRFGRSLVDCLNNLHTLEETGQRNPASRFILQVLGAAAEFERSLIRERVASSDIRDHAAGKVGKTVYSRSGRNMPPHRPKKVFDREEVVRLRRQGKSYRQIAKGIGIGSWDRGEETRNWFHDVVKVQNSTF
jgi:DNA invertase Pin-like site-specific DNA recombinase